MSYQPQAPFGIFDRAAYKNAFIDKFGADRWENDHAGHWEKYVDANGKTDVAAVIPDMPMDVFQWLREIGWPIGLWSHMAYRMTNDAKSTLDLYAKSFSADFDNAGKAIAETAQGVAKTSSKFALGSVLIFAAVLAVIYRDDIKAVLR